MNRKIAILIWIILEHLNVFGQVISKEHNNEIYVVPGQNEYCKKDIQSASVLPSGRYVTPVGQVKEISRSAFGLAVNSHETKAVVVHNNAISTVQLTGGKLDINRIPEYGKESEENPFKSTFIGIAFGKSENIIALSGGDNGTVVFYNIEKKVIVDKIDCNDFHKEGSNECFLTDLVWDTFSNQLWVLDRAWQEVYRIDVSTKKLIAKIGTGIIPFGLQISQDRKHVVIVNVGIYNYPLVTGVTPQNKDSLYLHFPPYGANTIEAENGVMINGRHISGIGKVNTDESMTAWIIDVITNSVVAKIRTGQKVGEFIDDIEIVGGSHPNSIVCNGDYAYISQSQSDQITVIRLSNNRLVCQIPIITNTFLDKKRGYFPYGLDIDSKNKKLYVALLGYNAVGVVDLKKNKCIGFLPCGWGTSRVKYLKKTNELLVTSIRGLGAGPNGGIGFVAPKQGTYVGDIQLGIIQRIPLSDIKLNQMSEICKNNTFIKIKSTDEEILKSMGKSGEIDTGGIQHIVYITKENRTYDEVLGQLKSGNGDSTLARFGINSERFLIEQILKIPNDQLSKYGFDTLKKQQFILGLDNLRIAPNHLKIASQFGFSDNFYCDSDASIHGHHWMMGTIPNEYVETNSANVGRFLVFSKSMGRRFPRTTGAQDPEDYNQIGGLWEALERHKISVYNFGEANEYTDVQEEWYDTLNGTAMPVAFPMPKAIYNKTSRNYAGYNTSIPDQFRVEQFETEFTQLWLNGNTKMPEIVTIQLPNDHTSSPRPEDGYPFQQSYVADNDLALGRMIQFLSHTKYWKNMLIVITEDDPQGGVDHIDAHRSLLMLVGPYVKRNFVSHKHTNFGSILRSIYHLKGIPSVNQFDATSTLLSDFITDKPNFEPYELEFSDNRVFNPEIAMKKYNRDIPWREIKLIEPMDQEFNIKLNNQK